MISHYLHISHFVHIQDHDKENNEDQTETPSTLLFENIGNQIKPKIADAGKIANVKVKYLRKRNRIKLTWKGVDDPAAIYVVKVTNEETTTVVKRFKTRKTRRHIKSTIFVANKTYTISLRVIGTPGSVNVTYMYTQAGTPQRTPRSWNGCMKFGPKGGMGGNCDGSATYCGDKDAAKGTQMSCTPFDFLPRTCDGYGRCKESRGWGLGDDTSKSQWCSEKGPCGPSDPGSSSAPWHDAGKSMYTGGKFSAKAWKDPSEPWHVVFHGCDGAGIQASDCFGDTHYFEVFTPLDEGTYGRWPNCRAGDIKCKDLQRDESGRYWLTSDCQHNRCGFKHPGLGDKFSKYQCGW